VIEDVEAHAPGDRVLRVGERAGVVALVVVEDHIDRVLPRGEDEALPDLGLVKPVPPA
jgi:hypothetical protein